MELEHAKLKMQSCVKDIDNWMCMNKLNPNSDTTEVLVLSSPYIAKPSLDTLEISGYDITPTLTSRNIGVIFDEYLSLDSQISAVCKSSCYHLRNISKIRQFISKSACESLVHSFITSKLGL